MTDPVIAAPPFGPWNPGISSQVPPHLRGLSTIYRSENVFTTVAKADEMHDLTGVERSALVAFRPSRLALHEVLIRVTADLSVPDGTKIEDLGINFRRMTRAMLARCVEPRSDEIASVYATLRSQVSALIDAELAVLFAAPFAASAPAPARSAKGFRALLEARRPRPALVARELCSEAEAISSWEAKADAAADDLRRAVYRALARVVSALVVRHGRIWGGSELVASLASDIACNDAGGDAIGRLIEPWFIEAAGSEGYAQLPRQERPVVMNTKGPSASGKSTLRPLQKALAGDIGVRWSDFALISPDIWRKQLLDYATLGDAYKYGGAFTGEELQIVDHKLDRYMARKAERGAMSHLLIDRFRFDSFAPDSAEAGSNLLTRFGRIVYLFFMITPPKSLVERAWQRGLDVGRYKAVDDTLAHGVYAYAGMPQLFFTWIRRTDMDVHFEFLDNSVKLGERPRTVAFGWNDTLNVLDVKCLLDVERYRQVNIDASGSEFLYADPGLLAPEHNTGFLTQCVGRFREVNFAEQNSGRVYARLVDGKPIGVQAQVLAQACAIPDTRAGLLAAAPAIFAAAQPAPHQPAHLREMIDAGRIHTLGRWGAETS
ncbi:MAG: hypothetical protein M3023_00745 [Pseudomonadota bacterium]|nr:hypothetical protein [Pseudomonadota bacterium]